MPSNAFNVTGPTATVVVTPPNTGLTVVGAALQLTAQGFDAGGIITSDSVFTWTSTDSTKVRVSASGLVTGLAYGSATIAAVTGGVTGTAIVTVAPMAGSLTSLSAGTLYTCGVTNTGAAYCWGYNVDGQLGNGAPNTLTSPPIPPSPTPLLVAGGRDFATVSAGGDHTCGVSVSGAAYCWGFDNAGALGNGTTTSLSFPVPVVGFYTFAAVSVAGYQTCGLTTGGAAYCWGAKGVARYGVPILGSDVPVAVPGGLTFAAVSTGSFYACGVTPGGVAYCWGQQNTFGQLGNGTQDSSAIPVAVEGGLTFGAVSAGDVFACGVTTSGAAYCWGDNADGELGNGSLTASAIPVAVAGGLTFTQVSAGGAHACGLTTTGAAYCWGDNADGDLGNGSLTASSIPVAVAGGLTFAMVRPGGSHTCGLTIGGVAYCWGFNEFGQLGNGSETSSATPVLVAGQ